MARRLRKPGVIRLIKDATSLKEYVRGPGKGACRLELPGLQDGDARRWEQRLSRLQATCGCKAGLVAGLIGISVWIAFGSGKQPSFLTAPRVLMGGLITVVIPAIAAKLAALAVARVRLGRACRALLAEVKIG